MSSNGDIDEDKMCLFAGSFDTDEQAFLEASACGKRAVWEILFHDESIVTRVCEQHLAEILDYEQPQTLKYIGEKEHAD